MGSHIVFAQFFEPFCHSFYLELRFSLSKAFVDVSFGPFSVAGGDLFDAGHWVVFVVPDKHTAIVAIVGFVGLTSLSAGFAIGTGWVGVGAAVGKEAGIVKAAFFAVESIGHTFCVGFEFFDPVLE